MEMCQSLRLIQMFLMLRASQVLLTIQAGIMSKAVPGGSLVSKYSLSIHNVVPNIKCSNYTHKLVLIIATQ